MPAVEAPDAEAKAIIAEAQPGERLTVDRPLFSTRQRFTMLPATSGDLVRELRTDDVTLEVLSAMRGDSTIAAGLRLMSTPVITHLRNAAAKCDDPKVQRFVEATLLESGLLQRVAEQCCTALGLGCSINELVWETRDISHLTYDDAQGNAQPAWTLSGPALVLDDVAPVNPTTVPNFNRLPEGLGFRQSTAGGPVDIAPAKAFVYTHDQEFGNHWGKARDRDAYPYWLWKHFTIKSWVHWVEKKADPSRIGRYPPGKDRSTGADNQATMIDILDQIDGRAGVVFPNTRQSTPDGVRDAGPAWDITEVPTTDVTDIFLQTCSTFCTEILRSMLVPERVYQEGQYGTKAEAETHADVFLMTLDAFLWSIVTAVEQGIIAKLVLVNFGSDAAKATLEVEGLMEDERELLRDVLIGLLASPQAQAVLDIREIAERRGVPVLDTPPAGTAVAPTPGAATPGQPDNLVLADPLGVLLNQIADYLRDHAPQRVVRLAASAPPVPPASAPPAPKVVAVNEQRRQQVASERDALAQEVAGLPRLQVMKAIPAHGFRFEQSAATQDAATQAATDLAKQNPESIYTLLPAAGEFMVLSTPVSAGAEQQAEEKANEPQGSGSTKLADIVAETRARLHAIMAGMPDEEADHDD